MRRIDLRYEVLRFIIGAIRNLRKFQAEQTKPRSIMNNEINSPRLLALNEVSFQTSLSRSTLYREIDAGRLKVVKIGKSVRVTDQSLRDYIASLGGVAQS